MDDTIFDEYETDVDSQEDDSDTGIPESSTEPSPKRPRNSVIPKRKWSGAAVYKTKYQVSWKQQWPFVARVESDQHAFRCNVCMKNVSCAHQGERDIVRHAESSLHKKNAKAMKNVRRIDAVCSSQRLTDKITRAEVKFTNFLVQHNIPISVSDHLGPLMKDAFPDSAIAKGYACARTKSTSIINGSLGPHFKSILVHGMKSGPFSVAVDGSNDSGLEKMNPMTVSLFDKSSEVIKTHLLDMCVTTGTHAATAESIFTKMDSVLQSHDISWYNCVGISVDNTSVNIGRNNSIMTRVLAKNSAIYFMGCPCHIVHNTALKASISLKQISKFDIDELMTDTFFFQRSSKRKNELAEYAEFCHIEYRKILKYISVRWLSLEQAVDRTLRQYDSLKSYFLSEEMEDARFGRLQSAYSNAMTEVYLMFYHAALQLFVNFNKFLQREDPIISIISGQINGFLKKLLGKFVTIRAIKDAEDITSVPYTRTHQLPDTGLHIGITTRQLIRKLEDNGDISPREVAVFYNAVRSFYSTATTYTLANLPVNDEVLQNACFANVEKRETALFSQVEFFVKRYDKLLPYMSAIGQNKLEDEFLDYQLMEHNEIPEIFWESAVIVDGEESKYYRMDKIWSYLNTMKNPDGTLRFQKLAKVALLVLTLPHSNAQEERVFSMVTKNKTKFRPNLRIDGTLSSILSVKLANSENFELCYKFEPEKALLTSAKKATVEYNKLHK